MAAVFDQAALWRMKCESTTLAAVMGDVVGAAFEGMDPASIRKECRDGVPRDIVPAPHMGVEMLGPRAGLYTDDTNSAAAILRCVAATGTVNPHHIAYWHARHWHDGLAAPPQRGYPGSAKQMMLKTLAGATPHECATAAFSDGSFANGAAMKIFPIALACAALPDAEFREAVRQACLYSHVHPQGVDAAVVQAEAVRTAAQLTADPALDQGARDHLLNRARAVAQTPPMQKHLADLSTALAQLPPLEPHRSLRGLPENGDVSKDQAAYFEAEAKRLHQAMVSLIGEKESCFQIGGPAAVTCALLVALRHGRSVEDVVAHATALGGDTDTVAAMAGAISGALYTPPSSAQQSSPMLWCRRAIFDRFENGARGRDELLAWTRTVAGLKGRAAVGAESAAPRYAKTPMDHAWEGCSKEFHRGPTLRDDAALGRLSSGPFDLLKDSTGCIAASDAEGILPAVIGNCGEAVVQTAVAALRRAGGGKLTRQEWTDFVAAQRRNA